MSSKQFFWRSSPLRSSLPIRNSLSTFPFLSLGFLQAPMAAVDGPEWRRCALEEEAVLAAAQVLFSLQHAWLPDRSPSSEDDEGPSEVTAPPLRWGSVRKRSRQMTMEGMLEARREEAVKKKGKMRASPPSPLYYSGGSSASTSGGSGGDDGSSSPEKLVKAERPRPSEPHAVLGDGPYPSKVVGSERPPLGLRVPAPKSIRWSGKKKTIPEFQALEKSLVEERGKLQKEVEARRKDHEALLAENRKLKDVVDRFNECSKLMQQAIQGHHMAKADWSLCELIDLLSRRNLKTSAPNG